MKKSAVIHPDPRVAIAQLAEEIQVPNQAGLLFFCSAEYDAAIVSQEIGKRFHCPHIGCTSAGEIGDRYQRGGIVGVSFSQGGFEIAAQFISPLSQYSGASAEKVISGLRTRLGSISSDSTFAFCLIDGLSVLEEAFVAATYGALNGIPLIGGSAGDSLKFERTTVFCNGQYGGDAAAIMLVNTSLPFEIFQIKHFEPSQKEMVITAADPLTRTVYEIDGGPAATEYARILGINESDLTPSVFSANPVMLQIGEDWYVRSIQRANPDRSLTFYCAIEEGIPLTIGYGENFVENLGEKFAQLQSRFQDILLTIGCDCILRRLEIEQKKIQREVEDILRAMQFFGFSTYGEQVNAIHVNQTLTGVVLGRR